MDEEVRIPIFLDFDDSDFENELSGLKAKLTKLKANLDEISKSRTDRLGLYDSAKLVVADRTITHIRDTVQALGKENIDSKTWDNLLNSYKEGARAIDDIINKNETLKRSMMNFPKDWTNTDNAKELGQYMDALKGKIQDIGESIGKYKNISLADKVIGTRTNNINTQIKAINELIAKIGEYQKKLAEAEQNAREQTQLSSQMKKDGRSQEEIDAQKQIAKAARDAYAEMEKSSAEATTAIKKDIKDRMTAILNEYALLQEREKELKSIPSPDSRRPSNKFVTTEAEDEAAKASDKAVEASKREQKANKNSTASYYYKLRAVKMLGHTFDDVYKAMDRFGKKAISVAKSSLSAYAKLLPGVWAVQKAMQKATTQQKKFGRELKSTTREHEGFNISLKKALTTILKYGLGIRSLYILFRKLRSAITDGLGEMSQQFEDVNVRMSSILTSVNYMKASLTTIAEPLITLLAPALEKIAEIVANISYHVASFIAALSGQKNVYKAVKVQADYAESLDKTAKNAKKAKKELAGFDELNVLHSNDDDDNDYTMGWELVPALAEAFPIIDKIKDILSTLFDPIKKAWEKMKDFVINSFKYMVERLKSLAGTIWDDFLKVWTDGRVQKIFEDIFKIIGDIFLIIGNLAEAFEEAWKANDNGYRVLSAIVDILASIVDGIKRCADITVEWSKKLTFIPLFTAIADVMEQQVIPAVQKVVDLFVYLYEHVFLELVRYVVEDLAPTLVRAFGNVIETVGNIAEKIRQALETNDLGDKIIAQFEKLVTIVGDKILEVSEKTKEWSKGLDFTALFEAVLNFLEKIEPLVQTVANVVGALWTDVLLPFWEYIIEDGGPRLLNLLGQIFGQKDENTGFGIDWEKVTNDINALLPALEQFLELAWDVLLQIIQDLGKAFDDFVNSDNFTKIIEGFKDWVDNADPEDIAHKIETFVQIFLECYAAFKLVSQVIMPVVTGFMTVGNAINNLIGAKGIGGLLSGLGKIHPAVLAVIAVIGLMVASFGGVGNTIKEIKERIDDVSKHFSEFGEKINLSEKFDKLKEAVERLRPVFEALLDIIGGVVTVLGETLMGALGGFADMVGGIVDTLLGMWKTIEGASQFLGAAITGDTEGMKEGWSKFVDGVMEMGGALIEFFTGLFDSIAGAIAGFVDFALPDAAQKILEWKDKVVSFFEDLAYQLIGDPIVYDIQDGIIESFKKWIEDTVKNVTNWVKNIINKFKELLNKFKSFKDTASKELKALRTNVSNELKTIANDVKSKLQSIASHFKNTFSNIKSYFQDGFLNGLTSGLRSALSKVSEVCNEITSRVKRAFRISSPSKVFEEIGKYLMEGLAEGVDDKQIAVIKSMESASNAVTHYVEERAKSYDKLLDMKEEYEERLKEYERVGGGTDEEINRLFELKHAIPAVERAQENLLRLQNLYEQKQLQYLNQANILEAQRLKNLEKLNSMSASAPGITKGQTLPSNIQFKANTANSSNTEGIVNSLKSAIVESMADMKYNNSSDTNDIVVQIDGYEVFRAVRNQSDMFKNSVGYGVL